MSLPDYSEWLTEERLQVEEKAWLEAGFHKVYARELDEALGRSIAPVILELGCGIGLVPHELIDGRLRPCGYYAVDSNDRCLQKAYYRNKEVIQYVQADIRKLVWNLDAFDIPQPYVVCSFAVLKHFALDEVVDLLGRILTLAPVAVFSIPISLGDFRDDGVEFHHSWMNLNCLENMIEIADKEIVRRSTLEGEVLERIESEQEVIFTCRTKSPT